MTWMFVDTEGPVGPVEPVPPVFPSSPAGPVAPVAPAGPLGPVAPAAPSGPEISSPDYARLGDGFLVWESNRTGPWRIWTRRLDGSGLRQLTPDAVTTEKEA